MGWGSISQTMCQMLSGVAAQTELDGKHYRALGIENIQITGNLKFDVNLSNDLISNGLDWKDNRWPNRLVIMAASTREGEENILINAIKAIHFEPKPLLLIVPRHLKRLPEIEEYVNEQNLQMIKRSELIDSESIPVEIDVVIGDSFGEMASYYASSDIVVMGGTLLGTGGQNLIEPCALGKPVILGPSTFNFKQVSQDAIACGAAISICEQHESISQNEMTLRLISVLEQLLAQPDKVKAMGEQGILFTYHHQGATRKTINFLKAN